MSHLLRCRLLSRHRRLVSAAGTLLRIGYSYTLLKFLCCRSLPLEALESRPSKLFPSRLLSTLSKPWCKHTQSLAGESVLIGYVLLPPAIAHALSPRLVSNAYSCACTAVHGHPRHNRSARLLRAGRQESAAATAAAAAGRCARRIKHCRRGVLHQVCLVLIHVLRLSMLMIGFPAENFLSRPRRMNRKQNVEWVECAEEEAAGIGTRGKAIDMYHILFGLMRGWNDCGIRAHLYSPVVMTHSQL